jgi:DNA invertase Pin-like site-specific DNA recombinase
MPRKILKKIQLSESASSDQAVIYFRVSSPDQEKEGFSIPAQRKLLNEYGRSSRLKIVEEFVDIDTAKKSGRISFNQMVKFLQKNPSVTHILTEKVDRLYRNFKDYVSIGDLGCTLHLVKDGQVLSAHSRSSEKLQHDIKVVLAKNFIDNLSEEVRKGMTEKAEQGIWPSYAPLGYLNTKLPSGKNGIAQDKNRAKLVRRLFEKYATGNFSLKQLAEWAASASLTFRKSGRPINKATIQGILHNLIYTGYFEFGGKRYKGIHEPIISRDLWDEVQSVLNRRYSNRYRVIKHDLPFSGLIRCGHCGCAVIGEIKKGKYIYYHCTGQRGKCPEKYAPQEKIEAQFCDAVRRIVLPEAFVGWASDVLRVANADDACLREEAISRLTAESAKILTRLDAMYIDKLEGRITREMYERHAGQWKPELDPA